MLQYGPTNCTACSVPSTMYSIAMYGIVQYMACLLQGLIQNPDGDIRKSRPTSDLPRLWGFGGPLRSP